MSIILALLCRYSASVGKFNTMEKEDVTSKARVVYTQKGHQQWFYKTDIDEYEKALEALKQTDLYNKISLLETKSYLNLLDSVICKLTYLQEREEGATDTNAIIAHEEIIEDDIKTLRNIFEIGQMFTKFRLDKGICSSMIFKFNLKILSSELAKEIKFLKEFGHSTHNDIEDLEIVYQKYKLNYETACENVKEGVSDGIRVKLANIEAYILSRWELHKHFEKGASLCSFDKVLDGSFEPK